MVVVAPPTTGCSGRHLKRLVSPTFNPRRFRSTLAQLGERVCRAPEEFKAWRQNLGHEQVLTSLMSYGQVDDRRQAEILLSMDPSTVSDDDLQDEPEQMLVRLRARRGNDRAA